MQAHESHPKKPVGPPRCIPICTLNPEIKLLKGCPVSISLDVDANSSSNRLGRTYIVGAEDTVGKLNDADHDKKCHEDINQFDALGCLLVAIEKAVEDALPFGSVGR